MDGGGGGGALVEFIDVPLLNPLLLLSLESNILESLGGGGGGGLVFSFTFWRVSFSEEIFFEGFSWRSVGG